jgi:hypothetical protein
MFINSGDICILLDVEESSTNPENRFFFNNANPSFPLLSEKYFYTNNRLSKSDAESISIARVVELICFKKNNFESVQFISIDKLTLFFYYLTSSIFKIFKEKI